MSEREDYADTNDPTPDLHPWLALVGLTLPYSAVAFGWWVADLAAAGRTDGAWWDSAGTCVLWGVAAAVLVAACFCLPVLHRIRRPGHLMLVGVSALIYFALLLLFNFCMYTRTSGPFP
ncbi:MAG: hypothetical protein J2P46_19620 [Zavarzinella sp.]|nr:hypothetical protein [Zavarzinella sp.]